MHINVSTATRWGLNAVILFLVILALYWGKSIFVPTVLSVLLAAMLWPAVVWLNRRGLPVAGVGGRWRFPWLRPCVWRLRLPWGLACLSTVGGLVLALVLITVGFGLSMSKFVLDIGSIDKQKALYGDFRAKVVSMAPVPVQDDDFYFHKDPEQSELFKTIRAFFSKDNETFQTLVKTFFWSSSDFLWEAILILFVLLFLLIEGRMLTAHLVAIFGPGLDVRKRAVGALTDMANQIRSYLVWRTIINFAMALFLGLLYQVLHLSQPWTWAMLTAVLWYVPYIGPIIAGFPPVLDAFISCDPWVSVGVLTFYVLCVILEGYFVVPVVMGRSMELNATTVMLACLFWQLVWGVPGLFLAMPLMAAVRTICMHVPDWHPWADLMGTRENPPAPKHADDEESALSDGFVGDTQILSGAELQAHLAARKARKEAGDKM